MLASVEGRFLIDKALVRTRDDEVNSKLVKVVLSMAAGALKEVKVLGKITWALPGATKPSRLLK